MPITRWHGTRIEIGFRPFAAPFHRTRGCLRLGEDGPEIAARDCMRAAPGDALLQAGPVLVTDGVPVVAAEDPEGFSTTAHEFDEDLTAMRLPRMAIALTPSGGWLRVAVDGRAEHDAGLLLAELAELLCELGAGSALNLDGGASSALIAGGRLRNTPRNDETEGLEAAGETTSAIVFG